MDAQEIINQAKQVEAINGSVFKYGVYDSDPKKLVRNLAAAYLSNGGTKAQMLTTLLEFNPEFHYGPLPFKVQRTYADYASFIWDRMWQAKKTAPRTLTTLSFVLARHLARYVPENMMVVSQCNQKLKLVEIVFLLKAITHKIRRAAAESKRDWVVLSRSYLLAKKDRYKEVTGRALNTHKIAAILKLLNDYKFIVIDERYDPKNKKRKPNVFRAGYRNPYLPSIATILRPVSLAA